MSRMPTCPRFTGNSSKIQIVYALSCFSILLCSVLHYFLNDVQSLNLYNEDVVSVAIALNEVNDRVAYNIESQSSTPSPIVIEPRTAIQFNTTQTIGAHHDPPPLYSSFVCLGGDTDRRVNNYRKQYNALLQHSCHFKNICYSNKQKEWIYFSASSSTEYAFSEIIQTENNRIFHDFHTNEKHGFLMLHSMHSHTFTPSIKYEPFPSQDASSVHRFFTETFVYHHLQWVYNFGHALTDNFYSMYRALQYFHLYSTDEHCCRALFNYHWTGAGFDQNAKLAVKFINGLSEYLFPNKTPIFLGFDSHKQRGRDLQLEQIYPRLFAANDTINDLACFENIVVGTDDFRVWWKAIMRRFHHRWDFALFLDDLFRKHPFHVESYQRYAQGRQNGNGKQKILFISKGENDRRRWTDDTNVTAIANYLEHLFGVPVDCMNGDEIYSRSLRQQIEFIIPYTLVITACGAVSYIGAFMRSGTAMITVDFWNMKENATAHIDSYLWEYLSDRKTYYYYVTASDWEMPSDYGHPKRGLSFDDVRNNANYRVQPSRLAHYVYSALLWIEHYNAWNNTFEKPHSLPVHE